MYAAADAQSVGQHRPGSSMKFDILRDPSKVAQLDKDAVDCERCP